ncbi:H-NS histone family protein [Histidinibacterium aquaticum]|uniref:H-NS histone family protein n=1 Tax=Histidinibacterium aquaticum TaxID=2613962 RepID=A0A5J5GP56_9RHOB|nr:H-NS histone family protein [Histidinibacterium aquaticum]KAA9010166.1 H-NS histone family protein [Histidinibacterium aquaticum]
MAKIDLNEFSRTELISLRKDVEKALTQVDKREREAARKAAEDAAKQYGFSLSELTGGKTKKTGSKGAPQFRHPENSDVTWTGRGRRPEWVKEWVEAGKDLEELRIK